MKIFPQDLKRIYEHFSNNNETKIKGVNKLVDIIEGMKYNDLFIKKPEYLSENYKISKDDIIFIIDGNKWDTLKHLDLDIGCDNYFFFNILSFKEITQFEEYKNIFNHNDLFDEILNHTVKKQNELLSVTDKDKKYNIPYKKLQSYVAGIINKMSTFVMNFKYPMDDAQKEKFSQLLDRQENITHDQESALKLLKYSLDIGIDRGIVLNNFVKFINDVPIIQPNILKRFLSTVTLFTDEELKNKLPLNTYKELVNKNKSGKNTIESDAKIYKFDIAQVSHMLQKETLILSKNLKVLSESIESLIENIDDYVAVTVSFASLKTCNIYLMYEKDSPQLSRQVTEKLIDFCLEENKKSEEHEIKAKLKKMADFFMLDLQLINKESNIKRNKI